MTEVIDVQYTAIIKDGGLFIPNVFSDLNDGGSHIVQVEVDIEEVRQQLSEGAVSTLETPKKDTAKAPKKPVKRATKKDAQKEIQQLSDDEGLSALRKSAIDELEALDDVELSEIFKAYMNDGQTSEQISLENL
ncbi:RelB/StbD replicon stabilization protein (antitoxin to RelE/StbE) [Psychrobacter nivimaris]|uniref:RelB/StbD replicon stabilization protein (Antitoxin to RelE/StbE) n=1 Tax=Psychrobacter nivimaris TaxID=281738 RepID=A0A6N7C2L1_9GAMM|nr:RelB/StbD replicon stabilization protein (antitoxin to RelE/StbE) [Psychrobacter nivimaris]